jgi:hypothetical protein
MNEEKSTSLGSGPPLYDNWHKSLRCEPLQASYEVPLFTDARFTGVAMEGYGPYHFLNVVLPFDEGMRSALILRMDWFLTYQLGQEIKTYEEHYHGGWLADEAASLASLCLGVRLKAGSISRYFDGNDPKGSPLGRPGNRPTLNINDAKRLVVPSAGNNQRSLDDLAPLKSLSKLSPPAAGALIRTARLYQDALWVCESEPNLSWLLMVSAIETAAGFWRPGEEAPVGKLKASRPKLEPLLLEAGGPELLEAVATEIVPFMGATKKFIDFMWEFLPPPPQVRPWEWAQHSWNKKPIRKTMDCIYHYRSRALHRGIPFPAPMCFAPMKLEESYEEKPSGLASGTGTHKWEAKDIPIHLHTFEYMARGALLRWWDSLPLNPIAPSPSPTPPTTAPPVVKVRKNDHA